MKLRGNNQQQQQQVQLQQRSTTMAEKLYADYITSAEQEEGKKKLRELFSLMSVTHEI